MGRRFLYIVYFYCYEASQGNKYAWPTSETFLLKDTKGSTLVKWDPRETEVLQSIAPQTADLIDKKIEAAGKLNETSKTPEQSGTRLAP